MKVTVHKFTVADSFNFSQFNSSSMLLRWGCASKAPLLSGEWSVTQTTQANSDKWYGFSNTKIWWWLHETVICLTSPIIHDIQLGVSGWWFFSWRKDLFVQYVFANNKEITIQALLPRWPPIADWDRKAGSSKNVTNCVVEDGTCIEVDCGGTYRLGNCCWATDDVVVEIDCMIVKGNGR